MVGKTLWVWVVPVASVLAGCVDTVNVDKGESLVLNGTKRVVPVKDNPDGPWPAGPASSGASEGLSSSTPAGLTTVLASRAGDIPVAPSALNPQEKVGSNARRLVCAEPSPDALATLAGSMKVSATVGGQGGSLGGGLSEAAALAERTGATQILRDLGYRACEGVMNGVIGAAGYDRIIGGTPPTVLGLVAVEGLTGMRSPDSVTIRSDAPATTPDAPAPKSGAPAPASDSTPGVIKKVMEKMAGVVAKPGGAPAAEKKGEDSAAAPAPKVGANPTPITNAAADAVVKVVCLATAAANRAHNMDFLRLCLGKSAPADNETGVGRNDVAAGGREQQAMRTDRDRVSR